MLALYDVVRLAEVYAVGAVHAEEGGVVLVDLKDDSPGILKDDAPGEVRDTEAAIAVRVRLGDGDARNVHADVAAVELGHQAQRDGHEAHESAGLELALIVADVPAIIVEGLLFGIALHDLDARADDEAAADLDVLDLALALSERLIHQLGKARAEAVIHPVAGLDRLRGDLRRDKSRLICVHGTTFEKFCSLSK